MAVVFGVNKKNILLTIWLLLPIIIVSLLMVWIFYSLDKDRLMDDAPPVGAGAGDTGNANALGEWLAGNDADAISEAVKARREGRAIDPREWPGGVMFQIQVDTDLPDDARLMFTLIHDEQGKYTSTGLGPKTDTYYTKGFTQAQLKGSFFVICESFPMRVVNGFEDESGRSLRIVSIDSQVPATDLQVSDPMVITVRIDSIYEESP